MTAISLFATIVCIISLSIATLPLYNNIPNWDNLAKQPSQAVYAKYKAWADAVLEEYSKQGLVNKAKQNNMQLDKAKMMKSEMERTTKAWHEIFKLMLTEFFQSVHANYPFGANYYALVARCGSFGRNELTPTSDVDICAILIDSQQGTRANVNQEVRHLFERMQTYLTNYLKGLDTISGKIFRGYDETDDIFLSATKNADGGGNYYYNGAKSAADFYKLYLGPHSKEVLPNDADRAMMNQGYWTYALLPFLDAALIYQYPPANQIQNKWNPFVVTVIDLLFTTGDLKKFEQIVVKDQLEKKMLRGIYNVETKLGIPKGLRNKAPPKEGWNAKFSIIKPLTFSSLIYGLVLYEETLNTKTKDFQVFRNYNAYTRVSRPQDDSEFYPLTPFRMEQLVKAGVFSSDEANGYSHLFLEVSAEIFFGNTKKNNQGKVTLFDHGKAVGFPINRMQQVYKYLQTLEEGVSVLVRTLKLKQVQEMEDLKKAMVELQKGIAANKQKLAAMFKDPGKQELDPQEQEIQDVKNEIHKLGKQKLGKMFKDPGQNPAKQEQDDVLVFDQAHDHLLYRDYRAWSHDYDYMSISILIIVCLFITVGLCAIIWIVIGAVCGYIVAIFARKGNTRFERKPNRNDNNTDNNTDILL